MSYRATQIVKARTVHNWDSVRNWLRLVRDTDGDINTGNHRVPCYTMFLGEGGARTRIKLYAPHETLDDGKPVFVNADQEKYKGIVDKLPEAAEKETVM